MKSISNSDSLTNTNKDDKSNLSVVYICRNFRHETCTFCVWNHESLQASPIAQLIRSIDRVEETTFQRSHSISINDVDLHQSVQIPGSSWTGLCDLIRSTVRTLEFNYSITCVSYITIHFILLYSSFQYLHIHVSYALNEFQFSNNCGRWMDKKLKGCS